MWRSFYVVFRALSGAGFWVERRFTPAGLLLLGCMVLAAVFGVDTSLTVAYRIFTFLAALLAIAFVGAWLSGTGPTLMTNDCVATPPRPSDTASVTLCGPDCPAVGSHTTAPLVGSTPMPFGPAARLKARVSPSASVALGV